MKNCCENCIFVHTSEINAQTLQRQYLCRRYPPTVSALATPQGVQLAMLNPQVSPVEWCGEWLDRVELNVGEIFGQEAK